MKIENNYSLKHLNAFKVEASAKFFTEIHTESDLLELAKQKQLVSEEHFVLGSGTNTLLTKNFNGLVIKMAIRNINVLKETDESALLEIGAGESWNGLVHYAINNGFSGVENMVLIPGSVGAAPVQNIAAYGQNLEDVFDSLDAFDIKSGDMVNFKKKDCEFAYRDSLFKQKGKGNFIITKVRLNLLKNEHIDTSYHSRYGSLTGELEKFTKPPYNVRDVAKAVTRIRETKFPDWEKVGTAGSFFLNPVISKDKLIKLQKKVPEVQYYPVDKLTYPTPNVPEFDHANHVKVAAGWLLEELGWKGKRIGNVGTSPKQSLVVINYGGATAKEILEFTKKMQEEMKISYDIDLVPEVNII